MQKTNKLTRCNLLNSVCDVSVLSCMLYLSPGFKISMSGLRDSIAAISTSLPFVSPCSNHSTVAHRISSLMAATIAECIRPVMKKMFQNQEDARICMEVVEVGISKLEKSDF